MKDRLIVFICYALVLVAAVVLLTPEPTACPTGDNVQIYEP